jgi:putative copper resistance protein D
VAALAVVAVVTAVLATAATSAPTDVFPTGPFIEYGLPIFKALTNVSIAAVIGSLMLAAFVLPVTAAAYREALDLGAGAAIASMIFAAPTAILTFFNLAGSVRPEVALGSLGQFLSTIAVGQAWTATLIMFSLIAVFCFAVRSRPTVIGVFVFAVLSLIPLPLQGHAAGDGSHTIASTALWLHIAASAGWVGGLAVLVVFRRRLAPMALGAVLAKYSTAALVAFIVLTVAGVAGAALRITDPSQLLTTPYGVILTAKTTILVLLGGLGAWYRLKVLPAGELPPRTFWSAILAELALMGIAIGLAVVLTRTAPPGGEELAVTASERLTGLDLPQPLTAFRLLDSWALDPLWLLVAGFAVVLYAQGVLRVRRRGHSWPWFRGVSMALAMLMLVVSTSGWLAVYGTYLLSIRVLALALMTVAVPILLVVAGCRQLLGESLTAGARTKMLRAASWWAAPLIASTPLVCLIIVWPSRSLLRWSVEDPVGTQLTLLLAFGGGLLFFSTVLGTGRAQVWPTVAGAGIVAAAVVTSASGLLAGSLRSPDWYGVITEGWTTNALLDQRIAGVVLLGVGAFVVLVGVLSGVADRLEARAAGHLSSASERRPAAAHSSSKRGIS